MQPAPGGLVAAEAHLPLQLHRRNPALARGDQEDRQEPAGEAGLGLFEHAPGEQRVLLAAGRALVDQPRLVRPRPLMAAARTPETDRSARLKQIRPTLLIGAEPRNEARQILRQHRPSTAP